MATKKVGRPKGRRMKHAENKIKKLEEKILTLESDILSGIDISNFKHEAISLVKKENNRYYLLIYKVCADKKIGKLIEERDVGDAEHRARFELNKFLAVEFKIKGVTNE